MANEGIKVLRAGVGDRHVLEMMRAEGLSFGGENSGHLIFSEYATTGDGIVAALQICRMMKESGKSIAELSGLMQEYPSQLLNLLVREKPPLEGLAGLQKLIAEAEAEFGLQGRQLIRYSGTEKKIRILVEHKDAATVERWIAKFQEIIMEEIG
jgi:phosphoglucosamine mutase